MPTNHRIYLDPTHTPIPAPGLTITLTGDEATHALKVKRIQPTDHILLLDGQGTTAQTTITHININKSNPTLTLLIQSTHLAPKPNPWLDVCAATPKANHAGELVDALSQLGAAQWTPLHTERSVVDPRPTKLDRLTRIAQEAAKQSGRPWLLHIAPKTNLKDLTPPPPLPHPTPNTPPPITIVAHQNAPPYTPHTHTQVQSAYTDEPSQTPNPNAQGSRSLGSPHPPSPPTSSPKPHHPTQPTPTQTPLHIRLIIGPEGGLTDNELQLLLAAGAVPASFGPHTMRIETAALAATAIILNAHMAQSQQTAYPQPS